MAADDDGLSAAASAAAATRSGRGRERGDRVPHAGRRPAADHCHPESGVACRPCIRRPAMIAATHPLVDRQPLPGAAGDLDDHRLGRGFRAAHAAGCAARPLRRAGHHPHHLSGPGPRIVENQVTYPLTTTMLSVPGAKAVRGFSFFGDSFVYVLFDDGTDLYWARSRVLEYLNQVQSRLPAHREGLARPGRHRRGLDLPVRLDRQGRHAGCGPAPRAAGLVPQVRAEDRARRGRGGLGRRHGAPVPGRARPRQAGGLPHHPHEGRRGDPESQPGNRRLGAGARRGRVHGARLGLPADTRRLPRYPADDDRCGRVGAAGRRRAHPGGPGNAARHRRTRWRGRGRSAAWS